MDSLCPTPLAILGGMKRFELPILHQDSELIATFGQAKLVKQKNGRFELRGGLPDDRFEAHEWASLFLHEAVFGLEVVRQ